MKRQFIRLLIALALLFLPSLVPPAGARGPTLGITNDSSVGVSVFWPVADSAFSLQWATSLTNPIPWQLYPVTPSVSGDGNNLLVNLGSLQATNPAAFFELVSNAVIVPAAPSVVTVGAGPVNYTGAELTGTVLPNLLDTTWWFQWGLDSSYGQTTASSVVSGSNTTPVAVQIGITGLSPGTTYHFQLYGSNVDGLSSGGDVTLTTPTALPDAIVQTFAASNITSTSAQLNGSVNPNGTELVGWFQWGTSTSYGNDSPNFYDSFQNFQVADESYTLNGLTPNTTYHYQVVAFNGGPNEAFGNDVVFTTSSPVQQSPPMVTIQAASSVSSSCATLNGTVNPNGAATTYYFVYGSSGGASIQTATFSAGSGSSAVSVQTTVCGLAPNTTYGFALYAANSGGSADSGTAGFTTTAASQTPPTVQTLAASAVTANGATLNGTLNANGADTHTYFEYGTTSSYGTTTTVLDAGNGSYGQNYEWPLGSLLPNTIYHYRIDAYNSGGTSYGADVTFTTPAAQAPPFVLTLAAGGITDSGASLNAFVNANGADTQVYFQYGTTTSYGSTTALTNIGSGTNQQLVQSGVSSLALNTTYHYRIVAYNVAGTSDGADASFTTLPLPPSVTTEPGSQNGATVSFNANVNPNGGGTYVWFQYGTTTNFELGPTAKVYIGAGNTTQAVPPAMVEVDSYEFFLYRAVASNPGGQTVGATLQIETGVPQ